MTEHGHTQISVGKKILFIVLTLALVGGIGGALIEGIYSFATGRSLIRRGGDQSSGLLRMRMTHEERLRAAALTEGPYQRSLDPRIGMLLKGRFTGAFHDVTFTTDDQGQRIRTGPEMAESAQRIVILGDSVAFGYGVKDHETLAEKLEVQLANARPTSGRQISVSTVACPGWNLENAYHYLLSRIDEIDPDIVIWIPVTNDLDSSFSVTETGHRAVDHDPSAAPTDTFCSLAQHHLIYAGLRAVLGSKKVPGANLHGSNFVLIGGVSPESARRYRAVERMLTDLQIRLENRDCKLAICHPNEEVFQSRLGQLLSAAGSTIPRFGLFGYPKAHLSLDGDPHFNPAALSESARRVARFLVERDWVSDLDTTRLPQADSRFLDDQYKIIDADALRSEKRDYDAAAAATNGPTLDLTTGEGYHQIYGGLWHDGIMGRAALVALKNNGGQSLVLEFQRVKGRPGLYPNTISVAINDAFVADVTIGTGGENETIKHRIDVPEDLQGAPYFDVSFNPTLTTTVIHRRVERLAGIKLLRAAVEK